MAWKDLPRWLKWGIGLLVIDIVVCVLLYILYPLRGNFNGISLVNPPTGLEVALVRVYDIILAIFAGPALLAAFGMMGSTPTVMSYVIIFIINLLFYFALGAITGLIFKKR
jgi:hypothetical protein